MPAKPKITVTHEVDSEAETEPNSPVPEETGNAILFNAAGLKGLIDAIEAKKHANQKSNEDIANDAGSAAAPASVPQSSVEKLRKNAMDILCLALVEVGGEHFSVAKKKFENVLSFLQRIPIVERLSDDKAVIAYAESQVKSLRETIETEEKIVQAEMLKIKMLIDEANQLYVDKDFSTAEMKYQEASNILNNVKSLFPSQQADKDLCDNRIEECQRLLLARNNKHDTRLRDNAGFKKLSADTAFGNSDFTKAREDYNAALKLFGMIKNREKKDNEKIRRCELNLKDCEREIKKQAQHSGKTKVFAQHGFFAAPNPAHVYGYDAFRVYLKAMLDRNLLPHEKDCFTLVNSLKLSV